MQRRPLSAILSLALLFSAIAFAQAPTANAKPATAKAHKPAAKPAATSAKPGASPAAKPVDPVAKRLDEVVMEEVNAKTFMGAVLVARGNDVLLSRGYGSANLEWNIPHTPATKFRLGSVTKQFTAAGILLLEERGQLSVSDPIKKYIPDAPAAWDAITLHHLLSHTSGIPNLTNGQQFPEYETTKTLATTPAKTMARFRDRPLDFPVGERFSYSNSGYIVLGAVIEKVSGMPYARFVQENLFTPLGMKDTGYDTADAVIPRRAAGYERGKDGVTNAPFISMTIPFAAGGLYSTTEDLLQWEQALVAGKVIKPETFAKMTTENKGGYAYGLTVRPMGKHRSFAHGGGIEGFNTFLAYFPDEKITVIVLSNLSGNAPQGIARNLAAVAHGETVTLMSERKKVNVPAKVLAEYVGTYRLAPTFAMAITLEDGQLMAQATGQGKTALYAESETVFFPTVVEAKFEFFRDATGKVAHFVLKQGGREMKAVRE